MCCSGSSVGSLRTRSSIGSRLSFSASSSIAHSRASRPTASPGARIDEATGTSNGTSRCRVSRLAPAYSVRVWMAAPLVSRFGPQVARDDIVADRQDVAVPIGAQANALDGVRTMGGDVEDLLTGQRGLHRSLQLACRDRRQDGVGVHPQLAAEAAADERADQPHILDRHFQGRGDRVLPLVERLVRGVQGQFIAIPHGQRGMRLHHRMALQGRGVSNVHLHRRRGEGRCEITHGTVGRRRAGGPVRACAPASGHHAARRFRAPGRRSPAPGRRRPWPAQTFRRPRKQRVRRSGTTSGPVSTGWATG